MPQETNSQPVPVLAASGVASAERRRLLATIAAGVDAGNPERELDAAAVARRAWAILGYLDRLNEPGRY
jgi:hypothetical protein